MFLVAPHVGAWIETWSSMATVTASLVAPHVGRGLKSGTEASIGGVD
ncbi:MAG: hypothetical protein J5693_04115 [Bacteroidales bacterium]|nr:hypothetical protein [Bacteroidales bacterium]